MKQSRKIRRSWLRAIPEWMRCFVRSVTRVVKCGQQLAASGWRRSKKLGSRLSALRNCISSHTKEWAAAALAAGLIAAPYSVDIAAGGWQLEAVKAAPQDGVVVGGQATIAQTGNVTTIAQSSQRLAIDWTKFDIAKQETVNFQQPNAQAIALNRILGNNPTAIYGQLNANGQVYLSNPNGMLFAPGAQINVAGLIATTSHVDPLAFMQTGMINTNERNAAIDMQGSIFASGGLVEIKGATAINVGGILKATKLDGNGGMIALSNSEDIVVNGTIDASAGLTGNGGRITIVADKTYGLLDVTGARLCELGSKARGDGGFIETSGAIIRGLDNVLVNVTAPKGSSGTWLIDPTNITIDNGSGSITDTTIGVLAIQTALSGANVQIATESLGADEGNILITESINYDGTGDNSLWLLADKDITITSGKTISYGGSGLLVLHAGGSNTIGTINNGATISMFGMGGIAKLYYNPISGTYATANTFNITGASACYMLVNSPAQLSSIGNTSGWWNSSFALGSDINMTGVAMNPIGDGASNFAGQFDGSKYNNNGSLAGYTISNLTINQTAQYVGLFGYVGFGAMVSNLNLDNANITGNPLAGSVYAGGIAGQNSGFISGVAVNGGTITGNSSGVLYVGGVAGQNIGFINGATLTSMTINGSNVSTDDIHVGGVVGYNSGMISNFSLSGGTITGSKVTTCNAYVGGVAGYNNNMISVGTLTDMTITGINNSSDNDFVGGVVGYSPSGAINNTFVSGGTISGSNLSTGYVYLGGLVGQNGAALSGNSVSGTKISGRVGSGVVNVGNIHGEAQAGNDLYALLTGGSASITSSDDYLTTATVALTGATASVTQLTGTALTLAYSSLSNLSVTAPNLCINDNVVATSGVTLNAYGSGGTIGTITFASGKTISGATGTANITARPLVGSGSLITGYSNLVGNYSVYDYADLNNVRNDLSAGATYTQLANINATGNFTPIGYNGPSSYNWFSGQYFGNGFAISGLTINLSNAVNGWSLYGGLFAQLNSSTTLNAVKLVGGSITVNNTGTHYLNEARVGAIAASGYYSSLLNCAVEGMTISASSVYGQAEAGGIIGYRNSSYVSGGTVKRSVITAQTGDNKVAAGGIAGWGRNDFGGGLTDNYVSGTTISATNTAYDMLFVGGIVGTDQAVANSTLDNVTVSASRLSSANGNYERAFVGGVIGCEQVFGRANSVSGATLNNVTVTANISVNNVYIGGVLGFGERSTISDISIGSSTIGSSATGVNVYIGGVLGSGDNSTTLKNLTVNNVTVSGMLTTDNGGNQAIVGGIAGVIKNSSTISNASVNLSTISAVSVVGSTGQAGSVYAGGLVGVLNMDGSGNEQLLNSSVSGSTVSVSTAQNGASAGGAAGNNNATMSNVTVTNVMISANNAINTAYLGDYAGNNRSDNNLYVTVDAGNATISSAGNYQTSAVVTLTGSAATINQASGSALTLNGVSVTSRELTVSAAGSAITQTPGGALFLNNLIINTAASVTLNNAANSITNFSFVAVAGAMQLQDVAALTLTGTNSAGLVNIYATGGMTLAGGTSITSSDTGNSIILGTSGNFVNSASSAALAVPAQGRWLVYVVDKNHKSGTMLAPVAADSPLTGITYGTLPVSATGNYYCYQAGDGIVIGGSVSGIANGTTIVLVENGVSLGQATVSGGTYSITYSGLDQSAYPFMTYASSSYGGGAFSSLIAGTAYNLSANSLGVNVSDMSALRAILTSGSTVYTATYLPYSYAYGNKDIALATGVAFNANNAFTIDGNIYTNAANQNYNGAVAAITAATLAARTSGSINFAGSVTATNSALDLMTTNGAITISGAINANGQILSINAGSGGITLNNAGNIFGTLTASGGLIAIAAGTAMNIASISGSGQVSIDDSAGITINSGGTVISTAAAANASAATLMINVGTTGIFNNLGDAAAVQAPNGRWQIYAANVNQISGTALTENAGQYYNGPVFAPANWNNIARPNNRLVFTATTAYTVDANNSGQRIYGDNNSTITGYFSIGTPVAGDTLSAATVSFTTTADAGSSANTSYGLILTAVSGVESDYNIGYRLGTTTGTFSITKRDLIATITAVTPKTYDGTVGATVTSSLVNVYNNDDVTLTSGSFNSANVDAASQVTSNNSDLGGTKAGNYNLPVAATHAGTITAAGLVYTGTAASRSYGDANPAFAGTVIGFINHETIADATTGTMLFNSAAVQGSDVGSYNIDGSGLTANHNNYTFTQAAGNATALTISKRNLVATITAVTPKTYDGTANATVTSDLVNVYNNDDVTLTSGSFNSVNVDDAYQVTSGNSDLGGTKAGNYNLPVAAMHSGTITAAGLVYTGTAVSRSYGDANPAFTGTVTGFVNYETIAGATTGTMLFDSAAVQGSNVDSYNIDGSGLIANHNNYTFAQAVGNATALTISKRDLVATITAVTPKTYDGNAGATVTSILTNVYNNDNVTLTSGSFNSANVDAASQVTSSNSDLGGTKAGNYNLVSGVNSALGRAKAFNYTQPGAVMYSATITAAGLTYTGTAANRTYGDANPAFTGTVTGFVNNETITTATTGAMTFDSAAQPGSNVGSYNIDGSGLIANHGNYSFSQAIANATALTIIQRSVALSAPTITKQYDSTTLYTTTAADLTTLSTALVNGNTVTAATIVYTNSNVGNGNKDVNLSGIAINDGNGGNNYLVTTAGNSNSTISQAPLTINAVTDNKVYDGTVTSSNTPTYSGLQSNDSISGLTQAYTDKNFGINNKQLDVTGYAINDGNSGNNYQVTEASFNTGTITTRTLIVTATGISRPYNGTTAATVSLSDNHLSGDTVIDSYASAAFASPIAANNIPVSVTGISISGSDSANYSLQNTTASTTANITPVGPTPEEQAAEAARQAAINSANSSTNSSAAQTNQKTIVNTTQVATTGNAASLAGLVTINSSGQNTTVASQTPIALQQSSASTSSVNAATTAPAVDPSSTASAGDSTASAQQQNNSATTPASQQSPSTAAIAPAQPAATTQSPVMQAGNSVTPPTGQQIPTGATPRIQTPVPQTNYNATIPTFTQQPLTITIDLPQTTPEQQPEPPQLMLPNGSSPDEATGIPENKDGRLVYDSNVYVAQDNVGVYEASVYGTTPPESSDSDTALTESGSASFETPEETVETLLTTLVVSGVF